MNFCFFLLKKRAEYFNLGSIRGEADPDTQFVLITAEQSLPLIIKPFQEMMHSVHVIPEFSFEACRDIIATHAGGPSLANRAVIVCTDESLLITSALLRAHFGMNGARPHRYVSFHNKRVMKQVLMANNIRAPKFMDFNGVHTVDALEDYHEHIVATLGRPYVVKPLMNGGSSHVAIIDAHADLDRWHERNFDEDAEFSAEEYIPGEMYHCDSFVHGGVIAFARPSKYLYPNLDFTMGKPLGSFPLMETDGLYDKILAFNKRVLGALNVPDGALHLELMIGDDHEIVFIEIGARPPGAAVNVMHERNYGINLYELTLKNELGLPLDFQTREDLYHAWIYLSTQPGTVRRLNEPVLKSRMDIQWRIKPGDTIREYPSSVMHGDSARMHIYNPNYDELVADVNVLKHHTPYERWRS